MVQDRIIRRRTLAVALLSGAYFLLLGYNAPLRADGECDEICDSGSDCGQVCAPEGTCGSYGVCAPDYNCGDICNEEAACNGECIGDDGWTTCGAFGNCRPCTPDWEIKPGTTYWIGGAEEDGPDDETNNTCTYNAYCNATLHDYGNCGEDDQTVCGICETDYGSPYGFCCEEYECGGTPYC